jgi:hypothetical protein
MRGSGKTRIVYATCLSPTIYKHKLIYDYWVVLPRGPRAKSGLVTLEYCASGWIFKFKL